MEQRRHIQHRRARLTGRDVESAPLATRQGLAQYFRECPHQAAAMLALLLLSATEQFQVH